VGWEETHQNQLAQHTGQRQAHERIKRHHHMVIAKLAMVMPARESPV